MTTPAERTPERAALERLKTASLLADDSGGGVFVWGSDLRTLIDAYERMDKALEEIEARAYGEDGSDLEGCVSTIFDAARAARNPPAGERVG